MDEPTLSPAPAAEPAAAAAPPARRRRRWLGPLLRSFGHYLFGVVAVLGLVLGALWWLLHTEDGSRWLLARVPGLEISDARGALLGDFSAQRIEMPLGADGARLSLQGLSWSAPRVRPAIGGLWLRVGFERLQAQRVDIGLDHGPSTDMTPPKSLWLPLGLDVAELRVDELHVEGIDTPLRDIRGHVALGDRDGALHRVDGLQAAWDRLRLSGRAQVGTHGQLPLDAALQLTQQPAGAAEWSAALQLQGPLAKPLLQARLRAAGAGSRPAQTLDARAELRPFAAWPLGELQASAKALDLSALHADAPLTSLDLQARAGTQALDQPADLSLTLDNREAGRWNEGRLPVRALSLRVRARPDDARQLQIEAFDAQLGSARAGAGRITGSGHWNPADWRLDTRIAALLPALLDARAPEMRLDGRLQLQGRGFDGSAPDSAQVDVRGELDGALLGPAGRASTQPVQARLDLRANRLRIELRELLAQAGDARASLRGQLARPTPQGAWTARGQASLKDFDPLPWWPGPEDSPWRKGPHRLNADADVDVALPAQARSGAQWLQALRGRAQLSLQPSRLAGVPLSGSALLQTSADGRSSGRVDLLADGNRLQLDARLDTPAGGRADHWDVKAEMPALQKLQPLWKLLLEPGADARLAGKLNADARIDGRWPLITTQGQLDAGGLRFGAFETQRATGQWTLGTQRDAPLQATLEMGPMSMGAPSAEKLTLQLQGTLAAHGLALDIESKSLPPAWVETMQQAPPGPAAKRTLVRLKLEGGAIAAPSQAPTGWRGKVTAAEVRGDAPGSAPWLHFTETGVDLKWADGPWRLALDAGRADLLGAALRWSRIAWTAADPGRAPAQLEADATFEPLDVAPLLKRAQPAFGWGGDLRVQGRVLVRSAPQFSADVVFERASGDLSVTDDAGTRTLGLSDLRVGLVAQDGTWSFTTGLAGKTLGSAAGAVVVRSTPKATWPAADAPINGVLELQIADLGVWGPWLPPGWRLTGALHAGAAVGGRFGAPEYTGELTGEGIGVRNVLQGVDVRDGELRIAALGETARIEKFAASAGKGRLSLLGDASFGATPRAELNLVLEQFQLLGRIDRRIVASGAATLKLGRDTLALNGNFGVDEGLIDFSRSDAPRLSDDVHVLRGGAVEPAFTTVADTDAADARRRRATLDLRVQLGEKLRIRGQGLDAGLRGELRLSAPQGRLRVDGSVRTVDGTYRAYRQRLNIERGVLTFNGPIENPQLDIEAIRPNLDVRVGVAVTGTVLVPRVRLFSEPDMTDAEKLSWLLRGRASEGAGSGDTALLQAAAMALISGDEPGVLDQLFNVLGVDELSVRQSESGSGGAIVSVGKQLSRNWYVGYERGLNATTGNWQLIYRIAQRFTIRAQSGESNSIELIWSWRWN